MTLIIVINYSVINYSVIGLHVYLDDINGRVRVYDVDTLYDGLKGQVAKGWEDA